MRDFESDDNEALVPHSHAVLGLKLDDAEQAGTVRRVGGALIGLAALMVLHFLVHVAHHGHFGHAIGHLFTAGLLPAVGYVAVSQRSSKATWAFHMMAVAFAVLHAVFMVVVLFTTMEIEAAENGVCANYARPCKDFADLGALDGPPSSFTEENRYWRCFDPALCVRAEYRCDHKVNCFDGSDEAGCKNWKGQDWKSDDLEDDRRKIRACEHLFLAEVKAPKLKLWWVIMTLPTWGLCIFAAYHSLEFYIQLRVHRLSARVNRATADATVFEASGQAAASHDDDVVAE